MIECEQPNAGFLRNSPDIFRKRVAGQQMLLQPRTIAHTRDQLRVHTEGPSPQERESIL